MSDVTTSRTDESGHKTSIATLPTSTRLIAIDWMRGFVMVLMAFDHASLFYNDGRVALDSAAEYQFGDPLPALQFFARWITHLCAPTFLFLSGTALALSAARRKFSPATASSIDRDLLARGALLIALEYFFLGALAPHRLVSVLTAIGASMILMIPLRRLPDRVLFSLALAWLAGGEWVTSLFWQGHGDASVPAALLVARHYSDTLHIIYPILHWLPLMVLGWVFGNRWLQRPAAEPSRMVWALVGYAMACLLLFALIRAAGGYGNMFLPAYDHSLIQWLHVSKYPPSLSFLSLELGLMAAVLAGFVWIEPRVRVRPNGLLLVLGQTALFFYLLHFVSLGMGRMVLGIPSGQLGQALVMTGTVIALLYPFCWWFRSYKRRHPTSLVRFL